MFNFILIIKLIKKLLTMQQVNLRNYSILLIPFVVFLLLTSCGGPSSEYDAKAIESLDKLAETMGDLESCSYTLNTIVESPDTNRETLNDVYMSGPNKMYINVMNNELHYGFWYNGKTFSYMSYEKQQYDVFDAPATTLEMIDQLHEQDNVDFPASDFFYPSLTDDIMDSYSKVYYDEEEIDGVLCVAIEALNDLETLAIWINKETNLPHRLLVVSTDETNSYDAVFSNWKSNPELPDELFEFQPSEGMEQSKFQNNTY